MGQLPALLIVVPLLTSFIVSMVSLVRPRLTLPVSLVGLVVLLMVSIQTLIDVVQHPEPIRYVMDGWVAPYGIEFVIDGLNAGLLVLLCLTALLTLIHSTPLIEQNLADRQTLFQVLYLLLVTGLIGMTITGDAFNMYVMIEISALSSYALIGLAGGRAYMAALHYIILGSIGAGFYLLGVGYLFMKTGSLNMAHLRELLPAVYDSPSVLVGFSLLMVGLFIKMGLFPLHTWLPNAYTTSLNAVSTLISPLATKVTVYVMIRIMCWVFEPRFAFDVLDWDGLMVWAASIAIVAGGIYALAQDNVKRMMTYIVVAEVGYMVGGFWLGNTDGFIGAAFHILNDVLVTLCVFMVIGSIYFKTGKYTMDQFRGLFVKMPYTMAAFLVGAFTLIGIPPTSGFTSKWYLIAGGLEAGHWQFVAALITASLINAVLMFRLIETAHIRSTAADATPVLRDEVPILMAIPPLLVAVSILVLGLYANTVIQHLILPILPF